jgi:uncharacterized protein YkwD
MKHFIFALLAVILLTGNTYSQTPGSEKFKKEFLKLINRTRSKGCKCGTTKMQPAPPLVWNDMLEDAALGHAKDMATKNYFSHESQDGRTIKDRIFYVGYDNKGFKSYEIGENIAQGQQSIAEVVEGWFNSEGHCKNLMRPTFKEIGVATYNTYWVQDFGGREEFSDEMKKLLKSGRYKLVQ